MVDEDGDFVDVGVANDGELAEAGLARDEEVSGGSAAGGVFVEGAGVCSDRRDVSERSVRGKTDMRMDDVRTKML